MLALTNLDLWKVINPYAYPNTRAGVFAEIETLSEAFATDNLTIIEHTIRRVSSILPRDEDTHAFIFKNLLKHTDSFVCARYYMRLEKNGSGVVYKSKLLHMFINVIFRDKDLRTVELLRKDGLTDIVDYQENLDIDKLIDAIFSKPHRSAIPSPASFFEMVYGLLDQFELDDVIVVYAVLNTCFETLAYGEKGGLAKFFSPKSHNQKVGQIFERKLFKNFNKDFYDRFYKENKYIKKLSEIYIDDFIGENSADALAWIFDHYDRNVCKVLEHTVWESLLKGNFEALNVLFKVDKPFVLSTLKNIGGCEDEKELYLQLHTNEALKKWLNKKISVEKLLKKLLQTGKGKKTRKRTLIEFYEDFMYTAPLSKIVKMRSLIDDPKIDSVKYDASRIIQESGYPCDPKKILAQLRYARHHHEEHEDEDYCDSYDFVDESITENNARAMATLGLWVLNVYNLYIVNPFELYKYLSDDPLVRSFRKHRDAEAINRNIDPLTYLRDHIENRRSSSIPLTFYLLYNETFDDSDSGSGSDPDSD